MTHLLLALSMFVVLPDGDKVLFDAPVRLTVGDNPVNQQERYLYPSPVIVDIDNDEQFELVVGDLWGKLHVYEKDGETGDLAWRSPSNLQVDGEDLKVSNW